MEEGRQYAMNPDVYRAASTGDSSFFETMTDPNSSTLLEVTIEKNTVLHVALQFKKIEAAKKIVNLSPSLALKTNSKGNTSLHVAARVGDFSMVKLLIDQAKKVDLGPGGRQQFLSMVNQDGDTALHVAVRYSNFDVVKELINENYPTTLAMKVNKAKESALFLAVDRQDYNMASYILSAAPDCSYAGRHGMNVLHALVLHTSCSCNKGNLLLKEMEEKRQKFETIPQRFRRANPRVTRSVFAVLWIINMLFLIPIPKFFFEDDSKEKYHIPWNKFETIPKDFVKKVMEKFPSAIEQGDDLGWTPLHIAAHMDNLEFVKLLLEKGNSPAYVRNKEGLSTERNLWEMGARPSLRGALFKMGIQKLDPRKKQELAGDGNSNSDGDGKGNGKDKGSGDANMLVATLIATVTFTAAFTVPGGYNQNGNVGEGLAVLRNTTAFRVFLIANTLAFGLSTTSVFVHFLASATIDEKVAFHKKLARRIAFFTNWSIGALLVAFIAGTYTVVPHSLGITVTVLLCCCFLSSMFFPLTTGTI